MKISLCTITFRHHLLSLKDIALWAQANDFQGIELWGAHARNLAKHSLYDAEWLAGFGLSVPMVSDYLPTDANEAAVRDGAQHLCRIARHWNARKIRTFAGNRASSEVSSDERDAIASRLRTMCDIAASHGLLLLVETHPNTLADSWSSTARLIELVDHASFRINFDALHVWEAGDDPVAAHQALRSHVGHYHLKNVRSRADLRVFDPANVYAAAGRREGMEPLFDGMMDYNHFLSRLLDEPGVEASLEWFGNDCFNVLGRDRRLLRGLSERHVEPLRVGAL
ncbi:sugar phosphate isomerase/epimerase family protein [Flaviflagellibacter deserti]|uniref:Sugar phosphate isomerase/epimerase family protein n=1 Tax=Flaviflagellibacter deserti TaxID=2267266 RepID=A0ABV9YWB8_9HYPH